MVAFALNSTNGGQKTRHTADEVVALRAPFLPHAPRRNLNAPSMSPTAVREYILLLFLVRDLLLDGRFLHAVAIRSNNAGEAVLRTLRGAWWYSSEQTQMTLSKALQ